MSKNKVVPIGRKVDDGEPPEGWNIRSPFGFLAFDDTRGGRLARLGDVLLWIEKEKVLPRDRALQVLTDRLPEDAIAWVYGLTDGGYANKLPDGWLDTLAHRMQAPRRRQISPGISGNRIGSDEWYARDDFSSVRSDSRASKTVQASVAPAPEPGLPTLRLLLRCWGPLNQKQGDEPALRTGEQWPVNYLAVPLLKAAEWWGYGRTVEAQPKPSESPAATTEQVSTDEWDGRRLAERHATLKSDGQGKWTQRLVAESGVPDREIRRRIASTKSAGSIGAIASNLTKGKKTRR